MNKRNILKSLLLGLMATAAAACTDPAEEQGYYGGLRPGEVALQWVGPNMGIQHVKARGTDPKTAEEQKINKVHVFIFKQNGEYLAASDNNAFQGYQYVGSGQNMVLNTNLFENDTEAANATVIAVANMPDGTFGEIGTLGQPEKIKNIGDFKNFIYQLPAFTATMPSDGLPMIGRAADVDLSTNAQQKITLVQMQSLMARVDLRFTMDPYQASDDGQNPSLRIDEVRVGNFPMGTKVEPQLDPTIEPNTAAATATSGITLLGEQQEVNVPDFTGHILRENAPQELTLYMFEHARAPKSLQDVFGKDSYPDNITEEEKQRYKNDLADDEAAYIELEGIYTNHNGYKYAVTYRLYPGKNAVDDFTIRHNRQYIHNITITGITVNNEGKEALLDTRVDIDTEANPYFIEMLRELEHDAHFCVTPMDVFLYRPGSVKVEIQSADGSDAPDWIRMEPLNRAATEAGDGKRKYFTTDLLKDELNTPENISCTVTSDQGETEERIYFYIDENVPTADDANNARVIPAREARLHITYTDTDPQTGEQRTHERDIPIRQAGMLPVTIERQSDQYDAGYVGYTFYIEAYEEYLEHYDGKDDYDHSYPGLEWGFEGVRTGLGDDNGNHFMAYGWYNTMTIMQKYRDTHPNDPDDIDLNTKPRGAAEYCYNKNKRSSDGRVTTCNWFFPTIREIEHAIDKYFDEYREFQNNWYWSANPGNNGYKGGQTDRNNVTWTGEDEEYARATKSIYQNNKFEHATSEANKPYAKLPNGNWDTPLQSYWGVSIGVTQEGEGGYARRDKIFRIRAAYIPEAPDGERGYDPNPPNLDNSGNY